MLKKNIFEQSLEIFVEIKMEVRSPDRTIVLAFVY